MYSVLYVDDEEALLEVCKLFLEETGNFSVSTLNSANAAIERIQGGAYDAIISDYQMPEMDGITLLKEVRAKFGDIPFILFTGRGREEVVIEALNEGADFYLQKGGDPESLYMELGHKVRVAIQRYRNETAIQTREIALRESERRLAELIQFLPDAMMAIDRQCRVIIWNKAIEQMTGVPASEMLGKGDYAYSVPFYGKPTPQLLDLVLENTNETSEHYSTITTEGVTLSSTAFCNALNNNKGGWVYAKASPLYDSSGNVTGAIELIRDISDQKHAEESLRESEAKYRSLFNDAIIGVYRTTPEGRYLEINRAFARIAGFDSPEEMIEVINDIEKEMYVRPGDRQRLREILAKDGEVRDYEVEIRQRSGQHIWIAINARAVRDMEGVIRRWEGTIEDITSRWIAEKELNQRNEELNAAYEQLAATEAELRQNYKALEKGQVLLSQSEEKYRLINDSSRDFIYSYDLNGRFTSANRSLCEAIGISEEGLIGKTHVELGFPDAQCEEWAHLHQQVYATNTTVIAETATPMPDGTVYQFEIVLNPIHGAGGVTIGISGTTRDITQRKKAEEACRISEAQYRGIFENAVIGIYQTAPDGRLLNANDVFARMFGYENAAGILKAGVNVAKQLYSSPEDRIRVLDTLNRNGIMESLEIPVQKADKSRFWASVSARTVRDEKGNPLFFEGICIDITDRKEAEQRLRQSEERFSAAFSINPDPVAITDIGTGKIIDVNPAFIEWSGFSRDELIGKRTKDLDLWVHASDRDDMLEALKEQAEILDREVLFRVRSGAIRVVLFTMKFIRMTAGVYLLTRARDITERRLAEQAIELSHNRLKYFVDSNIIGILIATMGGKIIETNDYYLRLIGYSREEFERGDVDWRKITPPEWIAADEKAIEELRRTGKCSPYEKEYIRRDGTRVSVFLSDALLPGPEEQIVAFALDITERKRAEEALRISEERFRKIIETAQEGIWTVDGNYRTTFINDYMAGLLGYAPEEIMGRSVKEFMAEEEYADLERIASIRKQGIGGQFERAFMRKDGTLLWTLGSSTPIIDHGEFAGSFAMFTDISERIRSERSLQESQSLLDKAENVARIGSWRYELDTKTTQWSDGMFRLFAWDPKEFNGNVWPILEKRVHPEDLPLLIDATSKTTETHVPQNVECRLILPDGSQRIVRGEGSMEYNDSGDPTAIIGFYQDVTELRRALDESRIDEARLEGLLRINQHQAENVQELLDFALNEAICLTGSKIGYIYFYNDVKKEFTLNTWSRDVMQQCQVTNPQTVYELDKTGIWGEAVRQGRPIVINDFASPNPLKKGLPEGHAPLKRFLTIPVFVHGHIVAVVGVANKEAEYSESDIRQLNLMMDAVWKIVDRKQSEYAIRKANRQLNLLGSITRHDITNKISITRGYLGMARKKFPDPVLNEYLQKMESAINAIQSQIEFTKVYQELGTHEPQWQDPMRIIPSTHIPETVQVTLDDSHVEVYADPLLERVFFNLLDNSIRHGDHVSEIRVGIHHSQNGLVITWEDNGSGIPYDEKDRIFERDFGRNTGLGLFLSREILLLTGITIRETGEPGRGARFEITVPERGYRIPIDRNLETPGSPK